MQNANRSDCEKANKQTSTQKEQQRKLEKENSNETSITPPPLSPTVFQQYRHIRHRCSCNMTVAHPRDLLRCMRRKTPDFKGIPQGWIYNVKIIYWMAPMDKSLLSFECDVIPHTCCFRLNNRPNYYVSNENCLIFYVSVFSFSLVLCIYLFLNPETVGKLHITSSRTAGGMC